MPKLARLHGVASEDCHRLRISRVEGQGLVLRLAEPSCSFREGWER